MTEVCKVSVKTRGWALDSAIMELNHCKLKKIENPGLPVDGTMSEIYIKRESLKKITKQNKEFNYIPNWRELNTFIEKLAKEERQPINY